MSDKPIDEAGTVERIARGRLSDHFIASFAVQRSRSTWFRFTPLIDTELPALTAELSKDNVDDEWTYTEWLQNADTYREATFSVRADGDERPAGFMTMDTRLVFKPDGSTLSLFLDLKSAYVRPELRGHGYGMAMCCAAAHHFETNLANVLSLPLRDLGVKQISAAIVSECVSREGASAARMIVDCCRASVDKINQNDDPESLNVRLFDYVDYSGFLSFEAPDTPLLAS